MFSTLSSSSLLSIKGEMWRLVLWKPINDVRRPLHHIRLIIWQPLGQVTNLVNHTDQVTRRNGALMTSHVSYSFFLGPYNQVILVVQSNAALRTPALYRHLIITDILLCPWRKKALKFSLNSIHLIRTPFYSRTPLYEHPLNKDTSLSLTVCFVPGERKSSNFP